MFPYIPDENGYNELNPSLLREYAETVVKVLVEEAHILLRKYGSCSELEEISNARREIYRDFEEMFEGNGESGRMNTVEEDELVNMFRGMTGPDRDEETIMSGMDVGMS